MRNAENTATIARQVRGARSLLSIFAVAYFFAQVIAAAHAPTFAGELIDHIPSDCAVCLAGGVSGDPQDLVPKLSSVSFTLAPVEAATPSALFIDFTVRAAAPRAPPSC